MAIKKINTDLQIEAGLLDGDGNSGVNNQILISTGTGVDWVNASASSIIGGPYLPLSAGSSYPLTGDLTISKAYPKLLLNDTQGVPRSFSVGTSNETFTVRNETGGANVFTIAGADNATTFAGDITSTGLTVDYTGNRTGDAGILVTNDSSDWGIKVDKDGTDDYGILSQTDGENAIVVRNAAGTNKIQLQGDGDATFAGDVTVGGTLTETSARRFKENIKTLDNQISNISKLNPVSFDWKKDSKSDIGFIAEEVKEVYPNLVSEEDGEIKGVQYTKLTAVLVKALQDQQKQIDELKKEIFILKKK